MKQDPDGRREKSEAERPAATVFDLIAEQAAQRPEALAILAPGCPSTSYAGLLARIQRTAAALVARGIRRADRVAIVLPNGLEMTAAFLAVASIAAAAPLNPAYRERELDFYLTDLDARAVLVQSGAEERAAAVGRRLGIHVLEIAPPPAVPADGFEPWGTAVGPPGDEPAHPASPDDIALLLYTSGTTAWPKLVPLTHRNLCRSARNISESLQLTTADRCLSILPLFHIHGLLAATLASLAAGASLVATPGFLATRFFDWMEEFAPTWYTAVPTIHQAILARAPAHTETITRRRLRFLRSSSAALPPRVLAELEAVFRAPVIEAYGMTEAAHQIASNPLPPAPRKPGSVGPATGLEISVLDEAGRPVGSGETGEVSIRGENVTPGYHGDPEANAKGFTNGWFRTGDQGYLDAQGYLFLTGRLKELINRGGENIAPREIDDVLSAHPAIEQVVTFAVPDPKLGEEVGAAIVLRLGAETSRAEIVAFAAARLDAFKLPRHIVFLDELPKGPTGKLQREGLAERLGIRGGPADVPEGGPERAGRIEPRTDTERTIAGVYAGVLELGAVGVNESFFALGGDSLLALELSCVVEETFGLEVPIHVLLESPTVEALARYVEAARGSVARWAKPVPISRRVTHGDERPLSPGQEFLWVQEQLVRGTPINHRPGALRLAGRPDPGALAAALSEVVRRHEVLRTVYAARANGRPVAIVRPAAPIALPTDDLTALASGARRTRLAALAAAHAHEPLDLARAPALSARLVKLAEREHVLLLDIHHIAFDGWSMSVFTNELCSIYGALVEGEPSSLPELPIQYADFAAWQRDRLEGGELAAGLDHWRRVLDGHPLELALPTDGRSRDLPTGRGGEVSLVLPKALEERLVTLGRREGVTLFMTLLAGFEAFLHGLTGATDIVIGTMSSGRGSREVGGLIGLFMNPLVMRTDLSGDPTFREILGRVRRVVHDALANQAVPFGLLARTVARKERVLWNPLFKVAFQLRNTPEAKGEGGGLMFEEAAFGWGLARHDLLVEAASTREGLAIRFEHDDALFTRATIERWVERYRAILEAAAGRAR